MAKKKTSDCKACGNLVSKTAKYCPHCGEKSPYNNPTENAIFLVLLLLLGYALISSFDSTGKPPPQKVVVPQSPCATNFRECSSQEQLANEYKDGFREAAVSCKIQAEDMARYGKIDFPFFFPFGAYNSSERSYQTGIITLLERDAKVPNMYGAKESMKLACIYDLENKKVLDITFHRS